MWLKAPSVVLAATLAALAASSCGSSNSTSSGSSSPGTGAARAPGTGKLTVTPVAGRRNTSFTFAFTAPQTAGRHGTTQTVYTLAVTGRFRTGCLADRTVPVAHALKNTEVMITLDPVKIGGLWCPGTYRARVTEIRMPYCATGTMCPQFIQVVATVGRTTFRVTS
jgi:hypothetical protein